MCGQCGRIDLSRTQMWLIQVLPEGVDLLFFNVIACNARWQILRKHLSVELRGGVGGKGFSSRRKTWGGGRIYVDFCWSISAPVRTQFLGFFEGSLHVDRPPRQSSVEMFPELLSAPCFQGGQDGSVGIQIFFWSPFMWKWHGCMLGETQTRLDVVLYRRKR